MTSTRLHTMHASKPQAQPRSRRNTERLVVAVYIAFWSIWLVFDHASGYGLGAATTGLVLLSFIAFWMGRMAPRRDDPISLAPPLVQLRMVRLLRLVVLINGILLAWAIPSILSRGFDHRYLMFTDEGVFGNIALTFLYNYAVQPLNYAAVVLAMVTRPEGRRYDRYAYLVLAMMAGMTLGRFPIYFIIYFYFISFIMDSGLRSRRLRQVLKVSAVVAVVLYASWLLLVNKLQEYGTDVDNPSAVLRLYLLNYHVVGYHMLDYFIYAQDSGVVVDYPYPTTSMGVMGWLLHLLSKYSGVLPLFPNSFKDLMEVFNDGIYLPELGSFYNAFTTSILPFYADGGYMGVLLGYGFLGWISTRGRRLQHQMVGPVFAMVCFVLTFSLFQPVVQAELALNLLFLYFCNVYLLRTKKAAAALNPGGLGTPHNASA